MFNYSTQEIILRLMRLSLHFFSARLEVSGIPKSKFSLGVLSRPAGNLTLVPAQPVPMGSLLVGSCLDGSVRGCIGVCVIHIRIRVCSRTCLGVVS